MRSRSKKSLLLGLLPSKLVMTRLPSREKHLFLTFDDGPHPEHTPPILDLLKQHGATASFFLIGNRIDQHPEVVSRIVAEGHQLGNHSWSHPLMTNLPLADQLQEIARADDRLAAYDGIDQHLFRPPSGVLPLNLLAHFARVRRTIAYWSYDSHDYTGQPAQALLHGIQDHPPRSGDVILMHDDNQDTVDVLARMLPEWSRQGYRVRAMPAGGRH